MLDLHYWTTPNGHKITMFLEETGLPYRLVPANLVKNEQFEPEFLKIAPNNKVPAIVDNDPLGGGEPISIFESGAILQNLAEKTGKLSPRDVRARRLMAWRWFGFGTRWTGRARAPQLSFHHEQSRNQSMLELYTDATPNGLKVSIALEEMGLEYNVHRVFLGGEQTTPEFTKLNPNQKIPVLVDDDIVVTESGAILLYLAEKTGKLLPKDTKGRIKTIEMVINQMASLGPMFGQLMVFRGPWQNKAPEVSNRYFKEVSRIYGVLNARLEGKQYFSGDEFTIADIAFFPWIQAGSMFPFTADLPLDANANLKRWLERVRARPAVQKGLTVPPPFPPEKQFEGFIKATVGLGDLHA